MLAVDVELGMVGAARVTGDGVIGDGTDITGGGGGGSAVVAVTAAEASLAILLIVSTSSDFISMGGCDMTIGCGGGGAGVLIIGLICVDPTFIVGAFAGDCCIVLITAAVFNIFAVTQKIN